METFLLQGHIEILQAGSVEEASGCVADGAQRGNAEQGSVQRCLAIAQDCVLTARLPGMTSGVSTPLLLMPFGIEPRSELSVLL